MIYYDNIVDVRFKNPEYTVIEVLYKKPDDERQYGTFVDITQNEKAYRKVQDAGWSLEKIISSTADSKRSQSRAYNLLTNKVAFEMAKSLQVEQPSPEPEKPKEPVFDEKQKKALEEMKIFDLIKIKNQDSYEMFKIKVWVMKQDEVKESTLPDLREKIAKSASVFECLSIFNEVLKDKELKKDGDI